MRDRLIDVPVIALACGLLFVLTIARLAVLVGEQRTLAITDSLTGLNTRRFLEARLPPEVARAERNRSSLALFIIDVDHFKSINDRYGHPAGDRALIEVACRLRSAARSGDLLARYGGEEFAVLLSDVDEAAALDVAERLRRLVSESAAEGAPSCTLSVGVALVRPHDTFDSAVMRADAALFRAKLAGRNRVSA
jgi:two-component system, cell cycle response regulator